MDTLYLEYPPPPHFFFFFKQFNVYWTANWEILVKKNVFLGRDWTCNPLCREAPPFDPVSVTPLDTKNVVWCVCMHTLQPWNVYQLYLSCLFIYDVEILTLKIIFDVQVFQEFFRLPKPCTFHFMYTFCNVLSGAFFLRYLRSLQVVVLKNWYKIDWLLNECWLSVVIDSIFVFQTFQKLLLAHGFHRWCL